MLVSVIQRTKIANALELLETGASGAAEPEALTERKKKAAAKATGSSKSAAGSSKVAAGSSKAAAG